MNEVQIFRNEDFGSVRTIEIDGKPYFVANDVAKALGYIETAKAVRTHCKGVSETDIPTNGGIKKAKIIPEGGIYRLIFLPKIQKVKIIPVGDVYRLIIWSKIPSAEKFERWIFDEVIPSIRQTGSYHMPQTYAEALRALADKAEETERLAYENKAMLTKAEFFDSVTDSKDAIPMADVAKVLDMGIGRNKLFEFLRNCKILMSDNRPYQKYIDAGYFRVVEQRYDRGFGDVGINIKTLVFQKGVDFIRKKLME